MKTVISNLLQNRGGNYILPFFWQHGELEDVLREYMRAIHESGIGAVCVESRPHPDYAGPQWWRDMDIILDEAKQRDMKVWILDDAHFPTGYAVGKMKEAEPELCKQYIDCYTVDVCGPVPQALLPVTEMLRYSIKERQRSTEDRLFQDDKVLRIVASRLICGNDVDDTLLDITDKMVGDVLEWDVPEGMWRIFVLYSTKNGGARTDYINMLDEQSCRVLIDAVYEPHWEHYKEDFGKTIAGFFSDEPAIGNTIGFYMDESIGRKDMPLPWSRNMPTWMSEQLGEDYERLLPALWTRVGSEELTAKVRYAYMNAVTQLVDRCFSGQIGKWCEDHGVEYIGHIIEDNNQHSHLGCSQGHFFRSMYGQHMSGIDDIGGQVILGGENHIRKKRYEANGDGEFYHFALGKLGSSLAHIDPKKKGRAMCEIFGAYGWEFGVRSQKYVLDHFLVRGINVYVPHAFSPKAFPDPDCPPHFYAHGENPQYRHFGKLMHYMNRMCELLNDGHHVAPVALLYHGEAEWTGNYMYLQKPARHLLEHQIDFDILPSDLFADMDYFHAHFDHTLKVNGEEYQTLVIPYAQFITKEVAMFASRASQAGYPVVFVDALPEGICDMHHEAEETILLASLKSCHVVSLNDLAAWLTENKWNEILSVTPFARLRYYHYIKNDVHMYLFNNEDPGVAFDGDVYVPVKGPVNLYDAMENLVYPACADECEEGAWLHVHLEPYQTELYIFSDLSEYETSKACVADGQWSQVEAKWSLSFAKAKEYPNFHSTEELTELTNVGKNHPDFSGFMRYETDIEILEPGESQTLIHLEDAYEGVEVWINDQYVGMKICPPYTFDISKAVKPGYNSLRIEVANTLANHVRHIATENMVKSNIRRNGITMVAPSGIIGKVSIITK
ncbi:glycosyl hydrolase [Lachnoclostridium sp. An169]|uniref:glycosyl hydrolase n=1 Tax=Lachnoclostridium sp. An169 TaxID=1965569 RepID=UPI001120D176|nr:glycosyl hydrolase [Lachnoclostridium sp. An169]